MASPWPAPKPDPEAKPWRGGFLIGLGFFALFALLGRGTGFSSDESGHYNTALSLVTQRSLAIAPQENTHPGRGGLHYSGREILPTLLQTPTCALGILLDRRFDLGPPPFARGGPKPSPTNWPVFLTISILQPLMGAITLVFLRAYLRYEGVSESRALAITLTVGLATPLVFYSKALFSQVFEAAWLLAAFYHARRWRDQARIGHAFYTGMFCGFGVMTRSAFAPVAVGFFVYLLAAGRATWAARRTAATVFVLLLIMAATMVAWINWQRWEDPLDFGHRHAHETFSTPLLTGLYGLTVAPGKGLFVYAPVMLLPVLFAGRLWRHGRAEVFLGLAITAVYLGVYAQWYDWHGGLAWGPRFLVALIPLWAALLGRATLNGPTPWFGALLLVAFMVGAGIQFLGVAVNPHWMNVYRPGFFAWSDGYLPAHFDVLRTSGIDDIWCLEAANYSLPATLWLVVPLAAVAGTFILYAGWLLLSSRHPSNAPSRSRMAGCAARSA